MLMLLLSLVSRVFVFVLIGAALNRVLGKRGEGAAAVFIDAALYGLIPLFMLLSVWVSPLPAAGAGEIVLCALIVLAAGTLFAAVWARLRGIPYRLHCLPIVFMNSAYLAIPVNALLWGAEGTTNAILYNIVVTLATFTIGVWWVGGKAKLGEIAAIPVAYAVAGGLALNLLSVRPPQVIVAANAVVTFITLPAMLLLVGYRLGALRPGMLGPAAAGVALRMGGGTLAGLFAIWLLKLSGPAAGVCLITSSMPPAVVSAILAERFGADREFAAATVFLGTILSIALIPVLVYFVAS